MSTNTAPKITPGATTSEHDPPPLDGQTFVAVIPSPESLTPSERRMAERGPWPVRVTFPSGEAAAKAAAGAMRGTSVSTKRVRREPEFFPPPSLDSLLKTALRDAVREEIAAARIQVLDPKTPAESSSEQPPLVLVGSEGRTSGRRRAGERVGHDRNLVTVPEFAELVGMSQSSVFTAQAEAALGQAAGHRSQDPERRGSRLAQGGRSHPLPEGKAAGSVHNQRVEGRRVMADTNWTLSWNAKAKQYFARFRRFDGSG